MSHKRLIVGQSEWTIDDRNVENVVARVMDAMENGSVTRLDLSDATGRPVIVLLNGRVTASVVVDLDMDTRPTEISG